MGGWSEHTPGGRLPNQCFSMKLGKFKKRFDTEDDATDFLEETNQTASMEWYPCGSCNGYHITSKDRGGMQSQRRSNGKSNG